MFHTFEVPLSSGFGASAAGALSLSFCLNDFFDLGLSKEKIFQIAHIAEVEEGGGLGDIIGLYQAGWELRRKEGAPGIGITEPLIEDEKYIIATKAFGPLKTKDIIRNAEKKKNIINAGKKFCPNYMQILLFQSLPRTYNSLLKNVVWKQQK